MVNAGLPPTRSSGPRRADREPIGIPVRSNFSKKSGSFVLNKRKKANAAFKAAR
jgi:hypothetical protein